LIFSNWESVDRLLGQLQVAQRKELVFASLYYCTSLQNFENLAPQLAPNQGPSRPEKYRKKGTSCPRIVKLLIYLRFATDFVPKPVNQKPFFCRFR